MSTLMAQIKSMYHMICKVALRNISLFFISGSSSNLDGWKFNFMETKDTIYAQIGPDPPT